MHSKHGTHRPYVYRIPYGSSQKPKIKRISGYQRGNQNPYIEEEQTTQWSKENVQKDKQRSTKLTYKTKDRVTGLNFY
jgi:hypothetical protein